MHYQPRYDFQPWTRPGPVTERPSDAFGISHTAKGNNYPMEEPNSNISHELVVCGT